MEIQKSQDTKLIMNNRNTARCINHNKNIAWYSYEKRQLNDVIELRNPAPNKHILEKRQHLQQLVLVILGS